MDSAPQPPRGRRDNGLASAEWGALVDLDPRLSEALLDSLAAVGVAAYVEPASGAVNSVGAARAPAGRRTASGGPARCGGDRSTGSGSTRRGPTRPARSWLPRWPS